MSQVFFCELCMKKLEEAVGNKSPLQIREFVKKEKFSCSHYYMKPVFAKKKNKKKPNEPIN